MQDAKIRKMSEKLEKLIKEKKLACANKGDGGNLSFNTNIHIQQYNKMKDVVLVQPEP